MTSRSDSGIQRCTEGPEASSQSNMYYATPKNPLKSFAFYLGILTKGHPISRKLQVSTGAPCLGLTWPTASIAPKTQGSRVEGLRLRVEDFRVVLALRNQGVELRVPGSGFRFLVSSSKLEEE